ncbi:MAG TPA: AAA family ATPase [Pseudonocardiaceae bacterium]|nr:AAA family ATPase [Pseudonocardiaceae bacterium]
MCAAERSTEPELDTVRDAELARLEFALTGLARGHGGLVELSGEPGIGKTWLLNRLAAVARERGLQVFHGRSAELDQRIGFCSISQALGCLVMTQACAGVSASTVDIVRKYVLTASDADATDSSADGSTDAPVGSTEGPQSVFPALRTLLTAVARRGTVLLLDDFHLADSRSAEFMEFLTRYPVAAPLLIVLAQRARQAPDGLRSAIAQGVESGTIERIDLRPLTAAESAGILGAAPEDPWLLDLHNRSQGIPLYLLALAEPAPSERLAARLGGELAALSPVELAVLNAGAVLGDEFAVAVAGAVAGLNSAEICAATAGLLRRDLVRATGEPAVLGFRHPMLRDLVYRSAEPCWRASAHRRAFEALAEHHAAASVLAGHIERCPAGASVDDVPVLTKAAREVLAERPDDAVRWLALGLDLAASRPSAVAALRRSQVDALVAGGRLGEARDLLAETVHSTESAAARARLVAELALIECLLGRYPEANTTLSAELAGDPPRAAVVRLVVRKAIVGLFDGDLPRPDELARLDDAVVSPAGGTAEDRIAAAGASALRGLCAAYAGDMTQARRLIDASSSIVDSTGDPELAPYPDYLTVLGWAETMIARLDDARRHLGRQRSICQREPVSAVLPIVLMGLSWACHCAARLRDAQRIAAEAKEVASRLGASQVHDLAVMIETAYLSWTNRGGGRQAVEQAERAVAVRLPRNWWFSTNAMLLLAQALIMDGDAGRGGAVILTAGGGSDLPFVAPVIRPWCFETLADIAAGDGDRAVDDSVVGDSVVDNSTAGLGGDSVADDWARRAERAAEAVGEPNHRGFALLARAHALRGRAEHRAAARLYREAGGLFATLAMTGTQIRSLNHAARCANAAGQSSEAMTDFLLARELARQCDATVVVEDTDEQWRRLATRHSHRNQPAAATPSTRSAISASTGPTAMTNLADLLSGPQRFELSELSELSTLTNRETEIARIAATGRPTREIAAALRLSPRTVDVHLGRIYRKLGVGSRAELVRLMAQLG